MPITVSNHAPVHSWAAPTTLCCVSGESLLGTQVALILNAGDVCHAAQVYLDRPQETLMWEDFAECIYNIQAGKPPDEYWPRISALTNKVVVAVQESADNDCKLINFKV